MKCLVGIGLLAIAFASAGRAGDEFMDHVDEALMFSADQGDLRAQLSGTLDLEGYEYSQPPPGLIFSDSRSLLNPRLTTYLDAQLGRRIYVFAESRADRGFDPGDEGIQWRLDEYALRITTGRAGRFHLQIGKFATVVGSWVARHDSWDNPFVTAPLPYENLTGLWDSAAPRSIGQLLEWSHVLPGRSEYNGYVDNYRRIPIIWGPSYAIGAALSGQVGRFNYALEAKNGSLSSRPEAWTDLAQLWRHPTISGRLGYDPNEMWTLGLSASTGAYLLPSTASTLPPGHGLGNFRETVIGQDTGFAWHHFQFWSEVYAARFSIPGVGRAGTLAYYCETKYKFTPQFFGAVRWNQQVYGAVDSSPAWSPAVWRIDLGPAYRLTAHAQFKLQYSLQHQAGSEQRLSSLLAAQFTTRF